MIQSEIHVEDELNGNFVGGRFGTWACNDDFREQLFGEKIGDLLDFELFLTEDSDPMDKLEIILFIDSSFSKLA